MPTARRSLLTLCCILASSCAQPDGGPETVEQRLFAMGTWVDVSFVRPADDTAAAAALGEIEATLRTFERDYYPWTKGELASLNGAIAAGRSMTVSTELAEILTRARELSLASEGLFEPGLGRLVELWGFHTTVLVDQEPPPATALRAALMASGSIAELEIDGSRVQSARTGLKLDLGGIAKGAAVERILRLLESHGVSAALVNAGGDLAVVGQPPGGRLWRVGIRDPRGGSLLGILELQDGEAAFTSGDYERFYEHEGQRLHHLLDPMTGHPVMHTQALTVVSDDPTLADAAATALFVAGPARWREIADRLGVEAVLRVDAGGTVEMTESMAARLAAASGNHDIIAGSGQEQQP